MKLLTLDPSSTAIGYAIFECRDIPRMALREAGKIEPVRTRDDANTRIRSMVADLMEVIDAARPTWVVIEDTSGKVGKRHRGAGAGLAVYGKALGWVIGAVTNRVNAGDRGEVQLVPENEWTRGIQKERRRQWVAAKYRSYDPAKDAGGDVSDAIALGEWWLTERRFKIQEV